MHNLNRDGAIGGNLTLSKVTLAINAGSAATFKTTGTTTFCVDGVFATKAALSAQAFSAGHTSLAASQQCVFAVWCTLGGTISTTQGKIVSATDVANGVTIVPLPGIEADKALFGLIEVKTGATTFVPGTTALDAANVTTTYFDTICMPSKPLTT